MTKQNYMELYKTIQDYAGLYRTIHDNTGPWVDILPHAPKISWKPISILAKDGRVLGEYTIYEQLDLYFT